MRITGAILGFMGVVTLVGGIHHYLAVLTRYGFAAPGLLQMCFGEIVCSLLVVALGVYLYRRGGRSPKD